MTEHSILSPSSFPRLVACPGSRKLEAMFPREESEAAAEGILAHECAARELKVSFYKELPNCRPFNWSDEVLVSSIELYIEHVAKITGATRDTEISGYSKSNGMHLHEVNLHIEERIKIPYLHHECFGTPDCWYYDEEKNEVHVWDFKYGFKPVEVRENWQLIGYASGVCSLILEKFHDGNKFLAEHWDMVFNLHIVQPRARHREGPIRTWSLTRDALRYYENELQTSVQSSFLENPLLEAGSHCTYCKAKSICPQLKKESNMIVDKELEIERELKSPNIHECVEIPGSNLPNLIQFTTKNDLKEIFKLSDDYLVMLNGEWDDKQKVEEYLKTVGKQPLSQEILDTRRSIEILKLRLETLEKQALEEIQAGREVPGFSVKKVWGRLGWNIPAKDVQMLGNELGLVLTKPAKLDVITPLQAIKLAKKDEAVKERIKSLASCKFNGYKLVAEGDSIDDEEVNFDDL